MTVLEEHIHDINQLCSTHKVKQLYAFGSVLTDKFNTDSDIDLIVDFEPIDLAQYADNYYDLKFSLEDVLQKPVDLLEDKAIKIPTFDRLLTNSGSSFMDIEIKTWLYDILNAINEIDSFFADRPKDFIAYQHDIRTKRAVERNIEIIGEAMNRI